MRFDWQSSEIHHLLLGLPGNIFIIFDDIKLFFKNILNRGMYNWFDLIEKKNMNGIFLKVLPSPPFGGKFHSLTSRICERLSRRKRRIVQDVGDILVRDYDGHWCKVGSGFTGDTVVTERNCFITVEISSARWPDSLASHAVSQWSGRQGGHCLYNSPPLELFQSNSWKITFIIL